MWVEGSESMGIEVCPFGDENGKSGGCWGIEIWVIIFCSVLC